MVMEETPEDKHIRSYVAENAAKKAAQSSNSVRIQKPKRKTRRKPKPVLVVTTEHATEGFVDFLRKNGVVALSVGFVIATQVQVLSKQLISSFIDPLFSLLWGQTLTTRSTTITFNGHTSTFTVGAFVYGLINFLFVVLMLYIIIKVFKLDKLDITKEEAEEKKK